jgi:hypothetical protein
MTARELVKKHGLMYCADHVSDYSAQVLRGLAKIADDYGKVEYEAKFLAALQAQAAKPRGSRKAAAAAAPVVPVE